MQLNQDSSGTGFQSEINITPLVDVVLVLLIIFMVVIPLAMQGYNVDIPRASANTVPVEAASSQVILNIKPEACQVFAPPAGEGLPTDCRVSLDDRDIPVAELPLRVKEMLGSRPADQRVLFLAADDRLNYEGVLRIVDLAKSNVDDLTIEYVTTN